MDSTPEDCAVMSPQDSTQMPLTPASSRSSMDLSQPLDMTSRSSDLIINKEVSPDAHFDEESLETALHVIETERDALTNLGNIYKTEQVARQGFNNAVKAIAASTSKGGRLIACGVGKSAKIAEKFVATMNSLGIRSTFLHPTEALHGDMGMIGPDDTILIVSFSGRTPELASLLPHVPPQLPRIFVSAHLDPSTCLLISSQPSANSILLPTPIPVPELRSFRLAAPTTSTTVALALTDALALAVGRSLHSNLSTVFRRFHPGGAIGAST